jgi:hypothetical protein
MTKSEAIAFYGSVTALALAAEVDQSTVSGWGEYPPGGRQLLLERKSNGVLKAEPDCMRKPKRAEVA